MNIIGLDIGTTTICAIAVDSESGKVLRSLTADNDTTIKSQKPYERIQNPHKILDKCYKLIEQLTNEFAPVACIGVTGQMHGIVYIDKNGNAVSPLYYWQDESGNEIYKDSKSYAEYLSEITGHKMATGFGGTTYFCHTVNGLVPEKAVKICTIHDYVAMKLCKNSRPLMHTSDAASFGLFDLKALCFDKQAIDKAGLSFEMFPKVLKGFDTVGMYNNSIPVSVAIGDNQASFLGSVNDFASCISVNVGTGSQISYMTEFSQTSKGTELRPCCDDSYICVGSSLCGGRAFALLESFVRETARLVCGEDIKSAYPAIDKFLANSQMPENPLIVSTRFCGSRDCPGERGSIQNLGTDNFSPQALIWGVLSGIAEELKSMYRKRQEHSVMIGSGNGLRKNKALQLLFSQSLGMQLKIPAHNEEASFGAALFGMTAAGLCKDIAQAQKLIRYI